MTDELKITGITIEADSVVIKGSDFDALCALAREDKQLRECLAEALGNYARLRTGVLDIADCRPMSATTRRRLRELAGAPPQTAVHNEKS